MRICYSCINTNHFITSFILAATLYKDCDNILILCDHHVEMHSVYSKLKKNPHPFTKVVILGATINNLKGVMSRIRKVEINTLHYFSTGFYNKDILKYINTIMTKIILTEEGLTTYDFESVLRERNIEGIEIEDINEIWAMHASALKGNSKEIRDLDIIALLNENDAKNIIRSICNVLEFKYNRDVANSRVVFMDQPLSKLKYYNESSENLMIRGIVDKLKDFEKVAIKAHPSDGIKKYEDFDCNTLDTKMTWELILLYEHYILDKRYPRTYITYYSGALANSMRLSNDIGAVSRGYYLYDYLTTKHPAFKRQMIDNYIRHIASIYNVSLVKDIENLKFLSIE